MNALPEQEWRDAITSHEAENGIDEDARLDAIRQIKAASGIEITLSELDAFIKGYSLNGIIEKRKLLNRKGSSTTTDVASTEQSGTFHEIGQFFASFCSLRPLAELKFSNIFSDIFKPKNEKETREIWGGINYVHGGSVNYRWPRPWIWARIGLGLIFTTLIACIILTKNPDNLNALPGALLLGAFAIPITCLVLIYEFDISRRVTLYEVSKGVLAGGVTSIGLALLLFSATGLHLTFLGATSAGIIEEIAKVVIAILLFGRFSSAPKVSHGLIFGAAVGAGFAGFETAGYMLNSLILNGGIQAEVQRQNIFDTGIIVITGFSYEGMFEIMFLRGFLSPFCHVVWTAIAAGAAWRAAGRNGYVGLSILSSTSFIKPFIIVVGLHMLWNSGLIFNLPKNFGSLKFWIWIWAVSFYGSWCLLLLYCQDGIREFMQSKPDAVDSAQNQP